MENSAAGTSLYSARHLHETKHKCTENAFTAKVESGTLKVKILRQDPKSTDKIMATLSSTTCSKTKKRRGTRSPQRNATSPPKPRPNRKHVPIFYEPQFRQPIKRRRQNPSSSMDELVTQLTTSMEVPNLHLMDESAASKTTILTSMANQVSQLPDGRRQTTSSSGENVDLLPKTKSMFVRNEEPLNELLRSYLPSKGSSGLHSLSVGAETNLSAGLPVDQTIGLTSALHQLASSSALYHSALDELSSACVQPLTLSSAGESAAAANILASSASATTTTLAKRSDTTHNRTKEGLEDYRVDTLSALQTAIDHARRASSANECVNHHTENHCDVDSTNSSARFYKLEPSRLCGTTHNKGNVSTATRIEALTDFSPSLTLQKSLLVDGIQRPTHSKLPFNVDGDKVSASSDDRTKSTVTALGPPPDAPPSFLLQNSLMGGGISLMSVPKTNLSLDTPWSLASMITQANETAKDLTSALIPESKTLLSLDSQALTTSLASEKTGNGKCKSLTACRAAAFTLDTGIVSLNTAQDPVSNGTVDLGPPPSGPPAFTIGNSLMGGGIELQPAAANVNTHNFDWKLHRATSNTSDDATCSPEVREIRHDLRAPHLKAPRTKHRCFTPDQACPNTYQ